MIEKIVIQKLTIAGKEYEYPDTTALVGKINELADVVNRLEESVQGVANNSIADGGRIRLLQEQIHALKTRSENVDPYAEQRKWIGKVCWFWDDDNTNSSCGILTSIDTETFKEPQFVCNDEYDYEHCKPVLPTDNAIYKGGDNE